MKPWPRELQEMFPIADDSVNGERPWWRERKKKGWIRSDSLRIQERSTPHSYELPDSRWTEWGEYNVYDMMGLWDAAHPLPHPGFRVGQTWAIPRESDFYVLTIQAHQSGSSERTWYLDYYYSNEELQQFLESAYLIHDAVCPHLAPWAPPL